MALAISITPEANLEVLALSVPRCGRHQLDMIPVGDDYPGLYRCPKYPKCENTCDLAPDTPPSGDGGGDGAPETKETYTCRSYDWTEQARDFVPPPHLRSCGVFGPIGRAPQSNITDGTRCLMLGGVAHGGGSKSGRRRKNPKGGKKFVDEPWWAEGGTKRK